MEEKVTLEQEFIQEFKELRKKEKYTQHTLANKTNVIRETIARIETGAVSPQISTMLKILEPIGYTITIKKIIQEDE